MKLTKRIAAAGLVVFSLAGCALPPLVPYDRAASPVRTIAMATIVEPASYVAMNLGGGAAAFGLVGALAQGHSNATRSEAYTQQVKATEPALGAHVASVIATQLERDGYGVTQPPGLTIPPQADGKEFDYTAINSDRDAILHVWFTVIGYVSPSFSIDYEPWVVMRARLVDARTRRVLFLKSFRAGWTSDGPSDNIGVIACGEQYRYSTFDALMADAARSSEGPKTCATAVAAAIAAELRPAR